ncbi:hypothetical protein ACHAWF_002380, partial [Thalassiosira exigua]
MRSTQKSIRYQTPDVIVAVGQGEAMQEFECYKVALSFASPYFDTMLSAGMAEANSNRIEFPDKDPEEWKLLYQFIDPSMIGDINHNRSIDGVVAIKLTPWFHEFQMDSFVQTCDGVLSKKVRFLSKKTLAKNECDVDFWAMSLGRSESESTLRNQSFGSIIELLQFACQYGLEKTRLEAEEVIKLFGESLLSGTRDLFTVEVVRALVQLFLPLEESGDSKSRRLVSRGSSTIYWELLSHRGFEDRCLAGLPHEALCKTEVLTPLAYNFMQLVVKEADSEEKDRELRRIKASLNCKEAELKQIRKSTQSIINELATQWPDNLYQRLAIHNGTNITRANVETSFENVM